MAHQPKSSPLALGAVAPDFSLPATDGREYSLSGNRGAKGVVVAFACNHCPYVKAYDERLNELAGLYQPKGINFLVINSNDDEDYVEDSFANMQRKVKDLGLVYPYLRDATQQVALDYGAGCTPEFFLFDDALKLVYTGRLDDNMENPQQVKQHYLRDACEAVLAGRVPKVQQSSPIGCSIKWKN